MQKTNKTTVQFELGSEAGSLYKTLRSFADRDLALSRIESRPIINTDWNYRFYVDIVAQHQRSRTSTCLIRNEGLCKKQSDTDIGLLSVN